MLEDATDKGASIHDKLMGGSNEQEVKQQDQVDLEEINEETESDVNADNETEVSEEQQQETQEPDNESSALELPELAQYLNFDHEKLDVNESGDLMIKTKIDGKEGQATLEDLVKSYQLEGHLNKQNMEVVELKKQLKAQQEESQTKVSERLQQAEDIATVVYQELLKEYDNIDWAVLREDDPAEWSAKQTDFTNRKSQIANMYQQLQDQRAETNTASTQVSQENIQAEQAKLVTAMGWKDAEQSNKDIQSMSNYAGNLGFNQSDFNAIQDHRYLVMMHKSMQWDALQKDSPRITNKIRKAPKLVKPGATRIKKGGDDLSKARANVIKNNGKGGSVAAYLMKKRSGA